MKLKELVEQYGEYTVPQELIEKLEKLKPQTAWDLTVGEEYYYAYGLNVCKSNWGNSEAYDLERTLSGAAFLTEEECKADIERRRVEALLLKYGGRRWFKEEGDNYHLSLQYNMVVICKDVCPLQGAIYFDLEQEAQKAVDEIGEDRIKRALFEGVRYKCHA